MEGNGDRLLHWYALSFMDLDERGNTINSSTYMGWPSSLVTKARITESKKHAQVGQGAVLLSCCYLGHMTKEQMMGE